MRPVLDKGVLTVVGTATGLLPTVDDSAVVPTQLMPAIHSYLTNTKPEKYLMSRLLHVLLNPYQYSEPRTDGPVDSDMT